mgnify:CR=1 FL=1
MGENSYKPRYLVMVTGENNNKYYLYVDAISYYHKTENTYMVDGK